MAHYDAIIIGAGQAGPSLALRLAGAGQTVAIIERSLVGGTCVNKGCTPTKAMVASAYAAHTARRGGDYGFSIAGEVRVDLARVKARKDAIVARSREGLEKALETTANCTLYRGHARFTSEKSVSVGAESLTADRIFINVGGRAVMPALRGIGEVRTLTNSSILDLDVLPEHLVVVGGSYVGLEFAQVFRRFGSAVTVVEMAPRLIQHEDEDISGAVKDILEKEGIAVRLNATCIGFRADGERIGVGVDCREGEPEFDASHVLLAVGRRPNTDDLGLDKAGIATDERGFVTVDDELKTNVPGIFALGECNGHGAFTHTAYNDYEIVASNLLEGGSRRVSDRITAYGLFIDPPLGRVGMSEAQARKSGRVVEVGRRPMSRVARAVEKGEVAGLMKIVLDGATREILGAAILGPGGDEAVQGVLDLIYARAPLTTLERAVHIHPTVSELLPTIVGERHPAG
jgi:pyruvate/2-oxoglutarate dehydrogenase complex dihydrolipoamide dehydrogenase (E3) component